jgi:heme-degrading monooxygenase HmoA
MLSFRETVYQYVRTATLQARNLIESALGSRFRCRNPLRYHKHGIGLHMFVVVWQFEIAEDKVAGFEAAYGPEGAWAQLFRSSPNYLGTELLRDAYIPLSYLTIDRWTSEEAFRAFRKDHDSEYEVLDRTCDALTSRENRVGAYTVCSNSIPEPAGSGGTAHPLNKEDRDQTSPAPRLP